MLIKSAIALTVMALWSSVASSPIQLVKRESSPITWDSYSLKIDGERVFWRAGEMAPWRLPSPALWKDVFEKMKSNGYNVAQMYFHWGYHSWNNQTVDFTGIRDIDELMRMANETGIYVSARPGPYINAETTSGGLAEWTRTLKGAARTDAADFTAAWKPYIEGVAKILAKWQYPEGPVIAVQIENEFGDTTTAARNYMALLEKAYTDNGIYVPSFHNAASDYASPWISGKGAPDMIGYDFYPIGWGPCPADPTVWTQPYSTPFAEIVKYKQDVPLWIPELGAGAYDTWGGYGENNCREAANNHYLRVYDRWMLAMTVFMQGDYMTYGGTNWGNLRFPDDYTSYDYGAPIDESRQIGSKIYEKKLLNYFLDAATEMAGTDLTNCTTSESEIKCDRLYNKETESSFHILRNKNISGFDNFDFKLKLADGTFVPVEDNIAIHGRDSKLLPANLNFLNQHIIYSTSEILTWATIDGVDYLVLHGLSGESAEIALSLNGSQKPTVQVGSGSVKSTVSGSSIRLNFKYNRLHHVKISGTHPLVVLMADLENAYKFWKVDTKNGPAFLFGSYLLRGTSDNSNDVLSLRADTAETETVEIFASSKFKSIQWNGKNLHVSPTSRGSRSGKISGPKKAQVPKLQKWTFARESPETLTTFDDSQWKLANKQSTNNPLPQPAGQPVLYASDYGYHIGHIWYRGSFQATGNETSLNITAQGGDNSVFSTWLNGNYLGSSNSSAGGKPHLFNITSKQLNKGKNLISVLVDGMGSDEEGGSASEYYKNYRGLREAHVLNNKGGETATISWKIQGNLGGEDIVDTDRGTFNVGGKYGERHGWHLPDFSLSTSKFQSNVQLPHNFGGAGIVWYFTDFKLNFPTKSDNPVVFAFDMPKGQSYRAEFYVNGWNYGKVIPNLGPQDEFPVPPGILNTNGENRLAIAVHGMLDRDNVFSDVQLKVLNSYTFSGDQWTQTKAPSFDKKVYGSSTGW